jgi:hypothetical protein
MTALALPEATPFASHLADELVLIEAEQYCDAMALALKAAQDCYDTARQRVYAAREARDHSLETWRFALRQQADEGV